MDAAEKRTTRRRAVTQRGRIVYNRGVSSMECVVRNLSPTGARLEVSSVVGIPDAFYLSLDTPSGTQPCRVKWRRFKEIGVAFDRD